MKYLFVLLLFLSCSEYGLKVYPITLDEYIELGIEIVEPMTDFEYEHGTPEIIYDEMDFWPERNYVLRPTF
jgi:hypothetical protein